MLFQNQTTFKLIFKIKIQTLFSWQKQKKWQFQIIIYYAIFINILLCLNLRSFQLIFTQIVYQNYLIDIFSLKQSNQRAKLQKKFILSRIIDCLRFQTFLQSFKICFQQQTILIQYLKYNIIKPKMIQQQTNLPQYHEFVIIGGGISGLQAALILAQQNRDFVLLEASDRLGGRIRTQKIKDVVKNQNISRHWLNEEILNTSVEVGATWISKQHSFILKIIERYELSLFPQYSDGLAIYGVNQHKYEKVETIADFYKKYQKPLLKLVNKIQNLTQNLQQLSNSRQSPSQSQLLEQYIKLYDNMTVSTFIKAEIQDQQLADIIMNEMQTLQCISCDNFSVLQLIDDDGCMQLLKLYCEKVDDTIDGLKVKQGMITMIDKMESQIYQTLEENQSEFLRPDLIQLNSPVLEIKNQLGQDVVVELKNGKKYSCMKVIFSVPIAVAHQVKISRISNSKNLIFQNQEYGSVTRFYFVFPEAFWRGKYNGYCSFSRKFPFNQLTQLSPSTLTCGIVAFVFVHNKFQKWEQQTRQKNKLENVQDLLVKYMLKILADMFLQGDVQAPELKDYFTYKRSFKGLEYIRAAYQTTTKPQVWKNIKDSGDDYNDSYSRNQYNIIYVGSQLGDTDQYNSYMQGAVRYSRMKIYQQLGKKDPWQSLNNKVIQW